MSCSAPKISYLFQPAIMKLLNTYKLRIWQNTPWNMKLLTTGPDLSFNVIVTFFLITNTEWAKRNPKGGDKERQAMSVQFQSTDRQANHTQKNAQTRERRRYPYSQKF
jgi:hypothetical protein